jgi:hypothetical protein
MKQMSKERKQFWNYVRLIYEKNHFFFFIIQFVQLQNKQPYLLYDENGNQFYDRLVNLIMLT